MDRPFPDIGAIEWMNIAGRWVHVVFLMLSSQPFPGTCGHKWGWLLLGGFAIAGWIARWLLTEIH